MRLKKPDFDRENKLYFDPVKITSPDQFVPLYLAQESPFVHPDYDHQYDIHMPDDWLEMQEPGQILREQLNHSYPKEYRLGINKDYIGYNWFDVPHYNLVEKFLGIDNNYYLHDSVVSLGLAVDRTQLEEYNIIKRRSLYPTTTIAYPRIGNIRPCIIILVKAKCIPYLRARIYLKLPINLSLGDMKIVYNQDNPDLKTIITSSEPVRKFIDSQKPIIEFQTTEQMREYLYPTPNYTKSKEQYLKDALAIMEEEVLV